jgi:hypothetical protein
MFKNRVSGSPPVHLLPSTRPSFSYFATFQDTQRITLLLPFHLSLIFSRPPFSQTRPGQQ